MTDIHEGEADFYHPLMSLEAYTYRFPGRPSPEQSMQVTVDVDVYRIIQLEPSDQVTEESVVEAFRWVRVVTVQPQSLITSMAWEDAIATLLRPLDLEPETYSQAMQELPRFVRERASAALQRGFNGLSVVSTVSQLHTFSVEEPMTGADDGGGERWFLAAMAEGKVRSVLCKDKEASCSICLDEFLVGSEMFEIRCSHAYHPDCIRRWFYQCRRLRREVRCPYCRYLL